MSRDEIDSDNSLMANSEGNSAYGTDETGSVINNGVEAYSDSGQPNQPDGPDVSIPTLTQRLAQERRDKVAGILAGTRTIPVEKDEPLVGPDGGMIGRGIKAAGDAYQGYIDGQRDTMMNTMKSELDKTFTPQLIDGVNSWAHGQLSLWTGIDTGFKPQYDVNKIFMPNAWFNTGSGTPPVMGFQYRFNPLIPTLVGAARMAGGENMTPQDYQRYAQSALQTGMAAASSPANQAAQQVQNTVNNGFDAQEATVKAADRYMSRR